MISAIALPTDFSTDSHLAFTHALGLAVRFRCRLDILHVRTSHTDEPWSSFPAVRQTLAGWGRLDVDAPHEAIEAQLGVVVRKIDIRAQGTVSGLAAFLADHRPDLIVVATHHTGVVSRWESVSEQLLSHTHLPTLLFGPQARPFITEHSGVVRLNSVLVPVTADPSPRASLTTLKALFGPLNLRRHVLHVGDVAPVNLDVDGVVHLRSGPVVETILGAAQELSADFIAMPRRGPRGVMEALRGSTSMRVIERAPCAVLALPA